MRTVVFNASRSLNQNCYKTVSKQPPLQIAAPTMEELHIEARDILIQKLGPIHVAFRIQFVAQVTKAPNSHRAHLVARTAAQPSGLKACI
jgi:hypothetical protein